MASQHKKENNDLKDLIAYFATTADHLLEVKLDKLIYIAQLYHYSYYGKALTKTRFFSLAYGPYAPIVRSSLKEQLEKKSIYLTESRTSSDPVYSNPCMIIKPYQQIEMNLSSLSSKTLRNVVEDWGDKPYKDILDYTTRTIPYLSTFYREPIIWTLIRPYPDLKQALSLPQRDQIHRFVEEPEKTTFKYHAGNERCQVSVNEVIEIYLALCGESPENTPSQEYLGFDLQVVLHAIDKLRIRNGEGTKKYPIEIDKAAELTASLFNSMSFRSYSSRVALKTGMLFLKKLGYSFKGDVLNDYWPEGNSQEILKEWFSEVTVKLNTR